MASKSLGTLTLNLVAETGGFVQGMSKAERQSEKWRREVGKNLKHTQQQIKTGLTAVTATATAATAAAGAALTKLTIDGLETVDSQAKLARSLDTSIDGLTALQMAAGESGLDDLEGSITRLNRRLGAAESGSGEAAKAVEELGLDLKELSQLDVDERVATIADAIRDSGISMQRAARLAQNLGFEQKEATAFFVQGGDAIRAYRTEIEELGLGLSELDAIKVEQANDAFDRAGRLVDSVSQQLAVQVAPILTAVSKLFVQNAKDAGGIGEATADSFNMVIDGVSEAANALASWERDLLEAQNATEVFALNVRIGFLEIAREILEIPTAFVNEMIMASNAIPGVDIELLGMSEVGSDVQALINSTRKEILGLNKELADELSKPLPGDQFKRFVFEARSAAEESAAAILDANNQIESALTNGGGGTDPKVKGVVELTEVYDPLLDKIKAEQRGHELAIETIKEHEDAYRALVQDLRTDEEILTDQLHERLAVMDAIKDLSDQERMETTRRIADSAIIDAPDFEGLAPEIGGPGGELAKVNEAETELEEWYSTQLGMLDKFRQEKSDLNSLWDEQELGLKREHEARLAEIEQARQLASLSATEDLFGNLSDLTKQFAGEQSAAYKALFLLEKSAAIARSMVAVNTAIAQASASAPFPANLGAMATVAGATAGLVSNIMAVGMAHDGIDAVPQTGTWLLEKGERVTTAETSAKLDQTLDNVNKDMQASNTNSSNGNLNMRVIMLGLEDRLSDWAGSDEFEKNVVVNMKRNQNLIKNLAMR